MKHFTLGLSFVLFLCFSFTCWLIVIWDPSLLPTLGGLMERMYAESWGTILLIALGFITLGCALSLFALLLGMEPGVRRQVVLEGEGGKIGVALDAVEDFIKRKCSSIPGIRDLQVRAEDENGELNIRTKLILELHRNVPEFTKEFQGKIYRELNETLGLQNIKEVQVMIHKIFPRESSKEPVLLSAPSQSQVLLKDTEEEDYTLGEQETDQTDEYQDEEVITLDSEDTEEKKEDYS